jgi:hypothetical protein
MARERLYLADNIAAQDTPCVTFIPGKFRFNTKFVSTAKIDSTWKVHIEIDAEKHQIWFVFTNKPKEFSGALQLVKEEEPKTSLTASAVKVVTMFDWVKKAFTQDLKNRRFTPVQSRNKNEWYISLIPSFENSVKREMAKKKINNGEFGIYRYIDSRNNEIVYIGIGDIMKRFNSPLRRLWEFDIIEYSYVSNKKQRESAEKFWIDYFKKHNRNQRPKYNRQDGNGGD